MDKTYYTVYKVTNKISGKFYIGTHKTKNLDDGYYGSGRYLKYAIEKHGIENFEKEILFVYDTSEEMFAKEAEIVNEDFLAEKNTYNLKIGGMGGFDHLNTGCNDHIKRCSKGGKVSCSHRIPNYHQFTEKDRLVGEETLKNKYPNGTFYGKEHSEESKKLIGEANKKLTGQRNSQYGTMWITNDQENRKIKKDDMIPDGWRKGRC